MRAPTHEQIYAELRKFLGNLTPLDEPPLIGETWMQGAVLWQWPRACSVHDGNATTPGYPRTPHHAYGWNNSTRAKVTWCVPANPITLFSDQWADAQNFANHARIFVDTTGRDFETFSSLLYAADTFVPLVDFGQKDM